MALDWLHRRAPDARPAPAGLTVHRVSFLLDPEEAPIADGRLVWIHWPQRSSSLSASHCWLDISGFLGLIINLLCFCFLLSR
jgi:hypothetical protein